MQFVNPKIDVSGATATVTGVRRYGMQTRDGQQLQTETNTTLVLRQSANGWHIESVRHQARITCRFGRTHATSLVAGAADRPRWRRPRPPQDTQPTTTLSLVFQDLYGPNGLVVNSDQVLPDGSTHSGTSTARSSRTSRSSTSRSPAS